MEIRRDDLLLGEYRVLDGPIGNGATAKVWRILHTVWGTELALKQPTEECLADPESRRGYLEECSHWLRLGLHPYIVTCYFVRRIGGIPMSFCEWCGGSLEQALADAREASMQSLLRIGVQTMTALRYMHSHGGLVHGDIKPSNIMLSENGTAKLADFGSTGSVKSFTPSYMSPEQYALLEGSDVKITPATDVYSWALMMLTLLAGERKWRYGSDAAAHPQSLVEDILQAVPERASQTQLRRFGKLLTQCLSCVPEQRPADAQITAALCRMLFEEGGSGIPEHCLTDQPLETADHFHNRAVSFLELGDTAEAETYWHRALELEPMHPAAVYGQGVYWWNCGRLTDAQLRTRLENICPEARKRFAQALEKLRGFAQLYRITPAGDSECAVIERIRFSSDSRYLLLLLAFPDDRYSIDVVDAMTGQRVPADVMQAADFPDRTWQTARHGNCQLKLLCEDVPAGCCYAADADSGGQKRLLGKFSYMTFSPDGVLAAAVCTERTSLTVFRTTAPDPLPYLMSRIVPAETLAAQSSRISRTLRALRATSLLPQKLSLLSELSGLGAAAQASYELEAQKLFPLCRRSNYRTAALLGYRRTDGIGDLYCSQDGGFALIVPCKSDRIDKLELVELPACRTVRRLVYPNPFLMRFYSARFDNEETLTVWSHKNGGTADGAAAFLRSVFDLRTMQCVLRSEPCAAPPPQSPEELPQPLRDFCEEKGYRSGSVNAMRTRLIAASGKGELFVYRVDCDLHPL